MIRSTVATEKRYEGKKRIKEARYSFMNAFLVSFFAHTVYTTSKLLTHLASDIGYNELYKYTNDPIVLDLDWWIDF
jgi:hypothetical protein